MRITDLFENDDQSDADLFGTHGTSVDMRFRLADAFDEYARIREEAVGEWHPSWRENNLTSLKHEQHVMGMARSLASIFRKQGLEPGLRMADSLFRHGDTRQYMWLYDAYDFLRDKKGIDMPEMVAQHFNESIDSDDELFGTKSTVANKQEISSALRNYARKTTENAKFLNGDAKTNLLNDTKDILNLAKVFDTQGMEVGIREFANLNKAWRGDLYFLLAYEYDLDLAAQLHNLQESAEPSDEELFGDDLPTVLLREITKFFHASKDYLNEELRRLGYDSMQDLYNAVDMDDEQITEISYLNSDIRISYALIQEFDKNPRAGVELFAEAYNGGLAQNPVLHNAESVAESIVDRLGDTAYQQLINYCNRNRIHIVHESAEPSDEELFGKEEFPRAEIIKLLREIGEYFHRTYDSEDLLDNADVVLDAADDFEKYGIKAGSERLIDVWSPHMMSYLTAMFRERLGFDLNKMFSRFVSDL